jgi:Predicted dehydrogenases and related proteins
MIGLHIGVIGIGSIAQKAYLPVYAGLDGAAFSFCTRNVETLEQIHEKYGWDSLFTSLDELIGSGINAAFVHAATVAHPQIIEKLLNRGISVYCDKPISNQFETTKHLIGLAESKGALLMTGFNRRFAPMNRRLAEIQNKSMILYEKNRINDPKEIRTFVYDDFIHVVDTTRFLLDGPVETIDVHARKERDGRYSNLTVVFHAGRQLAVMLMNRMSGVNQEVVQAIAPTGAYFVRNLTEMEEIKGIETTRIPFGDWESTLYKRGFEQIVRTFLDAVRNHQQEPVSKSDSLETHLICEKIIHKALQNS